MRNHTQVGGRVKRLSVAVLVGGREVPGADGGEPTYTPLTQEELDQIAGLVRSAIGFDAERGDSIDVKNMPFARPDLEEIETSMFDLTKADMFRLIELLVLLIIAVLAIFLVARPALAKLMPEPVTLEPSMAAQTSGDGANLPVVLDENGNPVAGGAAGAEGAAGEPGASGNAEEQEDLSEYEDSVRLGLIQQVKNVIEARPDDTVAVVRLWMEKEPQKNG